MTGSGTGAETGPRAPQVTPAAQLDEALRRLRDRARAWAQLPLPGKAALARALAEGVARTAARMVAAASPVKGIVPGTPAEGEEWLAAPYALLRILQQTHRSLVLLQRNGNTPVGKTRLTADGRLSVDVFPASRMDSVLFAGLRGEVHLQAGVGEEELAATRASFHRSPAHDGRVALVLGAGNVNSIPGADVACKLFNEGEVCLLKVNPVNAYMGPILREAFSAAIAQGWLAVVQGGAEEGSYLAHHPHVDSVHVTGSDRTHDALVWGPPGEEREARRARNEPLLAKPITSELGNVTPVLVVPGPWTERELAYQADDVAGMLTQNSSFNCVAGKVLVLPRGWALRERFLQLVLDLLARTPARRAWYPGAAERYRALTEGRSQLRRVGGGEDALPWTLILGCDAADPTERAFTTEPFCAVLSVTEVGSEDPFEYLSAAVRFANERLWGTLAASLLASGKTLADPTTAAGVEGAVRALRYGCVSVNLFPGLGYASGSGPWGAYPGSTLADIQSGRGLVHNTRMLEGVEKLVMRGPAAGRMKLPWFPSHRTNHLLGPRLTALEATGRWSKLPGVVAAALRA